MASHKMYKERKRILLDTVDETIERLESNNYNLGLVHKQNVLIPREAIASFKDDEITIHRNFLTVKRTVKKLSKDLKYDIMLLFDDKIFVDQKLEYIRSKSLTWYIRNRIVPIIILDLKKQKRSTEVLLRLKEPNKEELDKREKIKEKHCERKALREMINKEIKCNPKKVKKEIITREKQMQRWEDLRENNKKNYANSLGFYNIDITYKQGKQKQPHRALKRKDISSFNGYLQKGSVFDNLRMQRSQTFRIISMNRNLDKDYDADDESSIFSSIFS